MHTVYTHLSDEHESGMTELWLTDGVDHHLDEWDNSMCMESSHLSWNLQINTQPTEQEITFNYTTLCPLNCWETTDYLHVCKT